MLISNSWSLQNAPRFYHLPVRFKPQRRSTQRRSSEVESSTASDHSLLPPSNLTQEEFLRRFLQHVLPKGFPRIRYFGFLANRRRAESLSRCRALLAHVPRVPPSDLGRDPELWRCPCCQGPMRVIEHLTAAQILREERKQVCILDSS
jgi:hypothetical protein